MSINVQKGMICLLLLCDMLYVNNVCQACSQVPNDLPASERWDQIYEVLYFLP